MKVIDTCVRIGWRSQLELMDHMSDGWREFLGRPGAFHGEGGGVMAAIPVHRYQHPEGDFLPEAWPAEGGPPGTDLPTLTAQVLGPDRADRAILVHQAAITIPTLPNHYLALELARAANDWERDRWLGHDDRLYGTVLVPNQLPEEAAAEIRRAGADDRMVAAVLGGNGVGKPFGHPVYHPIYAAAHELGLPLILLAGGDATPDVITHTSAGGLAGSWVEYRVLRAQPVMTHLVSLVVQGVFEKFPALRVVVAGCGIGWLPSLFWRFDTNYKTFRREAPWLGRRPSDYLGEHIKVATWPLDRAPSPEAFRRHMGALDGVENAICYASGYPDRDTDGVPAVAAGLPPAWHRKVFCDNALATFRWEPRPAAPPAAAAVGRMD